MKIKINIQGEEKELTLDEAREVYSELSQIFGSKEFVYIPNPYPVIYPSYPQYPTITFTANSSDNFPLLATESVLARDWNSPSEDKAWDEM